MVTQYDDHPQTHLVRQLPKRKAVDFVAVRDGNLYLIEVKNFRQFRIANKPRFGGSLQAEISLKAFDTLAGLTACCRRAGADPMWPLAAAIAVDPNRGCFIVLWVEDDALWRQDRAGKVRADVILKQLKQQLAWSGAKAAVMCIQENHLEGVTVSHLPNQPETRAAT